MIALEGRSETADVLGGKARERDGKVEPQRDVASAVVLKAVDQLVRFLAPLAQKYLGILQGRRIDRRKPVGTVNVPRRSIRCSRGIITSGG